MKTRSIQTEIVYCLSASTQISASLKLFSISSSTKTILVALLEADNDAIQNIRNRIEGHEVDLSKLQRFTNEPKVFAHLKCSEDHAKLPGGIEAFMLSAICVKGL